MPARLLRRRTGAERPALDQDERVNVVVRDVVKSFGPIQALRRVSLVVGASEFVTITGPTGSSKSTLLNLQSATRGSAGWA